MKKALLILTTLAFINWDTGTTVKSPTPAITHVITEGEP